MPRNVLREAFDVPLEADEHSHEEPTYENEVGEDDLHYKESEAIPPAPKLQGTVPRTDANNTQTNGSQTNNTIPDPISIHNRKTYTEG